METYGSVHQAFHGRLNNLLKNGQMSDYVTSNKSIGADFGNQPRRTLEVIADSFIITNPRNRLMADCRTSDLSYSVANFLWSINENGSHADILAYNKHGEKFLDENDQFQCAIPNRLITKDEGNLLKEAARILKEDPMSRRAYIPLVKAADLANEPLDFPCPGYIHFLIRDDKLNMVVGMRSQSLVGVFPYDAFLFTMVQEAMALELGIDMGQYVHISDSLHIYDNEIEKAKAIKDCAVTPKAMEAMSFSPISNPEVHRAEKTYRTLGKQALLNDTYWDNLLGVLRTHE